MTQPRRAQPADFLVAAVHNASRGALVMAVVAVSLVGTDAAVAVHRTADSGDTSRLPVSSRPLGDLGSPVGLGPSASPLPPLSPPEAKIESRAARDLLSVAIGNALAKHSVRAIARYTTKRGTAVFDNRTARHHGVQHLRIYGGHVTVRVLGSTTYFTGDKRGLIKYFGYKPKLAILQRDRWVPLIAGNKGYRILTEGVTLSSLLHSERVAGPLRRLPQRVINGVAAVGVQGRGAGDGVRKNSVATWWISTGMNHPLPVEFEASTAHTHLTQTFSEWGKPVHVERPRAIF